MGDWIGIVVALSVGVPLLVVAVLVDRHRRRAREKELQQPPLRGDAEVDAVVPDYISQDAVDSLPAPRTGRRPRDASGEVPRLDFGHMDADFATAGPIAELQDCTVLLVTGHISSIRELLGPLSDASAGRSLVIAAASFDADVLATLKANRRVVELPVLAVEANPAQLMQLQDHVGGQILESSDLKAGWIPRDALGFAESWSSDISSIRVVGRGHSKG